MFGLRQHADRAAQQVRLVGVGIQHHVAAGMVRPLGQINALQVLLLIPGINVGKIQNGDDLAGRVDQGHLLTRPKLSGQRFGHRQRQGDGPGVEPAAVLDHRLVQHAMVGGRIHGPHQRAQAAIAQAINGRQIGVGDGHLRQSLGLGKKISGGVGGHSTTNRLGQAAVGRHQRSHSSFLFKLSGQYCDQDAENRAERR